MGNCLSSFRAQFRPNEPQNEEVNTVIPLTPKKAENITENKDEVDKNGSEEPKITALEVKEVNLYPSENALQHHTDLYSQIEKGTPVLRRGTPFKVKVSFDRDYNSSSDLVCLLFTVKDAKNPSYAQGTQIVLPLLSNDSVYPTEGWRCDLEDEKDEKNLTLEISSSPSAIVGEWTLEVETRLKAEETTKTFKNPKSVYLLFNPWNKLDSVFLGDDDWKKEYVLNETGLLWRGSHNRLRPCVWNYAQFQENILECCLYLLSSKFKLNPVARSDPIQVVRHISAVVNSPDEGGVVEGKWNGEFKGGVPPTQWVGSQVILNQYYKNKKPVKYGQCWVFSGVCTTVCRALGIPSRSVTNFASAHDTHNSLTVDYFYNQDGEPIDRLNIDSIWNFHVWNEAWLDRPDLEPGDYGGWQAFDATPQETSDGIFRCGPASVAAVKRGEINKPFDAQFLLAEVNADKVYWRYKGNNTPLKLVHKTTESIGQFISTKAIGKFEREDITSSYKHIEKSKEEREVMLRALRLCKNMFSRYYLNDDLEDVEFDFLLLDDIVIGQPFTARLKAKNKSSEDKTYNIKAFLRIGSMLYTGEIKKLVKKEKFEISVPAGAEEEMALTVKYEDYEKALVDQNAFNISVLAEVSETGHEYFAHDDFRVRMPDIKIETDGDIIEGKTFTANIFFTNPLPRPLKKGMFLVEGFGEPIKMPIKAVVQPEQEVRSSVQLTPKTSGEKTIAAKFHCPALMDVDGFKVIQVQKAPETVNKTTENGEQAA